jgi:hypothetical protein
METPPADPAAAPAPRRLNTRTLGRLLIVAGVLFLPVAIVAGWLDRMGSTQPAGSNIEPDNRERALARATAHLRAATPAPGTVALAAEATPEGHWRFVNQSGEVFTAGTPEEMRRVASVLEPKQKANARLVLYLSRPTLFAHRSALKSLPAGAELYAVSDSGAYRVTRRTDGGIERLLAEIRTHLVTELTDTRSFEETSWQLERPLASADVRVLALEPGGPASLSAKPHIDPATKKATVDTIDPAHLPAAMRGAAGQTLLITGRVDNDLLFVQPASGPERSVNLKELFRAAGDADVNLIVLQTASTPRQPGGRNWLWQRVAVQGLDTALQHLKLADVLNALAASNRRLAANALPYGDRTILDLSASAIANTSGLKDQAADLFGGMVSDILGRVPLAGVQASLQSAARQKELQSRLIPGVPSRVQVAYVVLFIIGLIGTPLSRQWWGEIWPPEQRAAYIGRGGYLAARSVRGLAYSLVFLPLTALIAAPLNLARQMGSAAGAPLRAWRALVRRKATPPPISAVAAASAQADNAARPAPPPAAPEAPRLVFPKFLDRMPNRFKKGRA